MLIWNKNNVSINSLSIICLISNEVKLNNHDSYKIIQFKLLKFKIIISPNHYITLICSWS